MNIIEHIYRYPVKGFPGEVLYETHLRKGEGISGDRRIALSNNTIPVHDSGAWTPCQAFLRMTIRPELTKFKVQREAKGILITSPCSNTHYIDGDSSDLSSLKEILGEPLGIHEASNNRGYWDHKDAAISIINLSTLEEIAKVIGQPIDPLRFRANIYVRSEPWSELSWVGQTLKIGEVCLDIIRPIDRCRTTSVNVDTGQFDLNIPSILLRHFGHLFCGVYAHVKTSGKIAPGVNFTCASKVPYTQLKEAIQQKTAPNLSNWPREAIVINIKRETEKISSFWIEDTLGKLGSFSEYKPGQYIRLHDLSVTHVWRSYTVSAVQDGRLRITVKRDSGVGSQAVHKWNENEKIIITGPFGNETLNKKSEAIHFISAGIGITPTVAKLNDLALNNFSNPVLVSHIARSSSELALWGDVKQVAKKLPKITTNLYFTENEDSIEGVIFGRPDFQAIANQAKATNADVHVCGPKGFMFDVSSALAGAGVSDSKINIDIFNSPDIKIEMRAIPQSEPIEVKFIRSNIIDHWCPEDGTLLDFAESRGAIIPSHCRTGLCNTCECKILEGSATRLVGLEGDDELKTLLCSSVPNQPLTLDI